MVMVTVTVRAGVCVLTPPGFLVTFVVMLCGNGLIEAQMSSASCFPKECRNALARINAYAKSLCPGSLIISRALLIHDSYSTSEKSDVRV